ncbi:MAG: hypothetical protein HRU31_10540 [Rhodobacteraceae bacterium]|nr:hypothetical protein [Paracoccaceae bacterium]
MDLGTIVIILLGLLLVAISVEAYLKRNRHRNISANRPEDPDDTTPLGMEEIDMDLVRRVEKENQRHASLTERHRRKP